MLKALFLKFKVFKFSINGFFFETKLRQDFGKPTVGFYLENDFSLCLINKSKNVEKVSISLYCSNNSIFRFRRVRPDPTKRTSLESANSRIAAVKTSSYCRVRRSGRHGRLEGRRVRRFPSTAPTSTTQIDTSSYRKIKRFDRAGTGTDSSSATRVRRRARVGFAPATSGQRRQQVSQAVTRNDNNNIIILLYCYIIIIIVIITRGRVGSRSVVHAGSRDKKKTDYSCCIMRGGLERRRVFTTGPERRARGRTRPVKTDPNTRAPCPFRRFPNVFFSATTSSPSDR